MVVTWTDKLCKREVKFPLGLQAIVFFYFSSKKGSFSLLQCEPSQLHPLSLHTSTLSVFFCHFSYMVSYKTQSKWPQRSEILSTEYKKGLFFSPSSTRVLWDIDFYLSGEVVCTREKCARPTAAALWLFANGELPHCQHSHQEQHRASETGAPKLGGSKEQKCILSRSGNQQSEFKVSVGVVLSRGFSEGDPSMLLC